MPYERIEELPKNVRGNLPKKAQVIFKEAYNSAWENYRDPEKRKGDASREEVSQKVAWNAVKTKYRKNEKGEWVEKA